MAMVGFGQPGHGWMLQPEADRFLRRTVIQLAFKQPATFLHACVDRLNSGSGAWPRREPSMHRLWRGDSALWTVPLCIALVLWSLPA